MTLTARQQQLIDQARVLMQGAERAGLAGDMVAHIALLTAATECCRLASLFGDIDEGLRRLH
jgi:hypothetical protein